MLSIYFSTCLLIVYHFSMQVIDQDEPRQWIIGLRYRYLELSGDVGCVWVCLYECSDEFELCLCHLEFVYMFVWIRIVFESFGICMMVWIIYVMFCDVCVWIQIIFVYLKCAGNSSNNQQKKRNYGHSYADGRIPADAQDAATSPEADHMVTHTPTAMLSAYVELTEKWGCRLVGPTRAYDDGHRRRRRQFGYADSSRRRRRDADGIRAYADGRILVDSCSEGWRRRRLGRFL